jgi:hypothetical protein
MPVPPDHPVLKKACTYKLMEFCYHGVAWEPDDHYLEIVLKREDEIVKLRFDRPQQLRINEYFPTQLGLFIANVSSHQLEGIAIEVGDFENGSIHFFAKSVRRLD